jgi:hypothetical protein
MTSSNRLLDTAGTEFYAVKNRASEKSCNALVKSVQPALEKKKYRKKRVEKHHTNSV